MKRCGAAEVPKQMVQKKILVVDDEPDIVESIKAVLEREGYSVVTAGNGTEALKKLEKHKVDIALIDFFMPDMSGRQLIEEMRKNPRTAGIKIAMVTVAQIPKGGQKTLKKMRVADYIKKPLELKDFVKRVKALA